MGSLVNQNIKVTVKEFLQSGCTSTLLTGRRIFSLLLTHDSQ